MINDYFILPSTWLDKHSVQQIILSTEWKPELVELVLVDLLRFLQLNSNKICSIDNLYIAIASLRKINPGVVREVIEMAIDLGLIAIGYDNKHKIQYLFNPDYADWAMDLYSKKEAGNGEVLE